MADVAIESAKGILQELVVVVSLVHTLVESFGSASDLYRKLKRKGKEITEGSDHEGRRRKPLRRRRDSDSDSDKSFHKRVLRRRSKSRTREKGDNSDSDEDSIYSSGVVLKREYERGYDRLGEKFAIGDLLAQNHLQAQIILLQQTIIEIYQSSDGNPASKHLVHLLRTARAAQSASTEALASLYRRLLPEVEHERGRLMPGAFPLPLSGSSELVIRPGRSRSRAPERTNTSTTLFCPYSADLQKHSSQPLAHAYHEGGDGRCPYCRFYIRTRPGKAWELVFEHPRDPHRDKTFIIGNRFMIKSHRQDGGFACILCHKFRDNDTACGEIAELVDHLWRDHSAEDLEREDDIREVG